MVAKDEIFRRTAVASFESSQNVQDGHHDRHRGQANQHDAVMDV